MLSSMELTFTLITDITQCFLQCEMVHRIIIIYCTVLGNGCIVSGCLVVTFGQEPSHQTVDLDSGFHKHIAGLVSARDANWRRDV